MKRVKFQLYEQGALVGGGKAITSSGGVVKITSADAQAKLAITDVNGSSLTNPRALTNGSCELYVADTVSSIDMFIASPDGRFVVVKGVAPDEVDDIYVDTSVKDQVMVIPFDQADFTANTETDTLFDEPLTGKALIKPNPAVRVTAIDATETIDVGTDSGDGGDANGFIAAAALGVTGLIKGTLTNGAATLGALLSVQDSANAGDLVPEGHVSAGKSITITTSAGSDTGKGYIYLPYVLMD